MNIDALYGLNLTDNPQLYCIDVDDDTYSTLYWTVSNGNIDPWHNFSGDCQNEIFGCTDTNSSNYNPLANIDDWSCNYGMTYIPDDNFEQELITLGIDPDSVLNDSIPINQIKHITHLDVSNKSIVDLTGIEDFTSL